MERGAPSKESVAPLMRTEQLRDLGVEDDNVSLLASEIKSKRWQWSSPWIWTKLRLERLRLGQQKLSLSTEGLVVRRRWKPVAQLTEVGYSDNVRETVLNQTQPAAQVWRTLQNAVVITEVALAWIKRRIKGCLGSKRVASRQVKQSGLVLTLQKKVAVANQAGKPRRSLESGFDKLDAAGQEVADFASRPVLVPIALQEDLEVRVLVVRSPGGHTTLEIEPLRNPEKECIQKNAQAVWRAQGHTAIYIKI